MLNPESMGAWGVVIALAGGAVRGSIPYMFVSLGECLTEKSGRINWDALRVHAFITACCLERLPV